MIDLICHGVGSPTVFKECLKLTGDQLKIEIKEYGFRYKPINSFITRHISYVSDGTRQKYVINDQYDQLFLNQTCLRPSCGKNCIYRDKNRQGDITIADFNGADKPFKDLSFEKHNYSTIVINTSKGFKLLNKMSSIMKMYPCAVENVEKYNPLFCSQTSFSRERDAFFADFCSDSSIVKKWVSDATPYKVSFKRKVFNVMPPFFKRFLKKTIK